MQFFCADHGVNAHGRPGSPRLPGWLWRALAFVALLGFLCAARTQAQTLESLEWVEVGGRPAARLSFNANVRYQRQAPLISTDLVLVNFQIVTADERVLGQVVEETRRLDANGGAPALSVVHQPTPNAREREFSLRLTRPMRVVVRQGNSARSIDMVFVDAALPASGAGTRPALPPMAQAGERRFAVLLATAASVDALPPVRLPTELQAFAVFTRQNAQAPAAERAELALGYFATEAQAQAVLAWVTPTYAQAEVVALAQANPAAAAAEVSALSDAAFNQRLAQLNQQAQDLLAQGQQALQAQRFQDAAEAFNKALILPPNAATQKAQALIGQAWEGAGRADKARTEYELYQKLYPQGEDLPGVQQRLRALGGVVVAAPGAAAPATGAATSAPAAAAPAASAAKTGYSASGSISQYYYGGNSRTNSLINISAGIDQNTLSRTNQSALVTSMDMTGKYRSEDGETRVVFRDTVSRNFMLSTNRSVLSAAYLDYRDLSSRWAVRVGRQSAVGGSMFGLFDGVSVAIPVGDKYKFDAMMGVPSNTLVSAPGQKFMGLMLEAENIFDNWGGNVYYVEQKTEGISDRKATGLEARYFGESLSMFSQVDYDLNFRQVNAATVQGSMPGPMDTLITMLLDKRKAPALQLSDALISSGTASLKTLLQLKTLAEIKDLALATAADARQGMISVSRALSPKWQASTDLRFSQIGALPAVGDFQAVPATGSQYTYAMQLTGSNLYSSRDVNGFNLSLLSSGSVHGRQLAYNNMTGFWGSKATIEPSLRFYSQTDNNATRVTRVSPGLRMSHKLSDKISLMGETLFERSRTEGLTNHETSNAYFFYLGYRYELF